ncbi:acyl-CoA synthetase (AMP-forming)/AMP-acid ligase II [Saccharopolyspora spinosa]|uniref:Acyl-CoA synthetase (AMP-forming)/AMP-acid ligase II n=2 Tax=Saccharopolyspora spinosa TaxID=60894 RepID=A0A2N3Y643_SACSN|nr:acyl-CoA synthetase (AMP-forming)/AMP-acid ligase II [Saccharopolyspora spinosa]
MKPDDMGVLFDEIAEHGTPTTVHLDRPLDLGDDRRKFGVADLAELVQELAGWLAAAGAGHRDRVAIVKENHWDYDLLSCAAVRIGAVPAKLSDRLPSNTVEALLKRLDPKVLVTTTAVLEHARAAGVDLASFAGTTLVLDGAVPGTLSLDDVRGHTAPGPRRRHDDEPLAVMHTSGTTGTPKLVVHSRNTIIGQLARFETVRYPVIGMRGDDTLVNASAYAHGRTFCWTASAFCLAPREIVIISQQDADRVDPVLRAHPPTVMEALPATYVRFAELTERLDNPFRRTRLFVSTYDAMHPPTIRSYLTASHRKRPLWMQGWGQSETGPLTFRFHTRSSVDPKQSGRTSRNVGYAVPLKTRLRVVDPDSFEPVPRGQPGLVLTKTAARCLDYVGETDRWQAKHWGDWWITGDLGVRNRDGSVDLLDREVDMVPELSCLRVEDILEERLPQALECVVLGQPGKAPLPVVVTVDGELDKESWLRAAHDILPLQEPIALTWDQIPRTGTGKVRRLALLEQITATAETHGTGRWT